MPKGQPPFLNNHEHVNFESDSAVQLACSILAEEASKLDALLRLHSPDGSIMIYVMLADPFGNHVDKVLQRHGARFACSECEVGKLPTRELCVVCHNEWVDSADGFDTCAGCLKRI